MCELALYICSDSIHNSLHSALCINWTSDCLTSSTITFKSLSLPTEFTAVPCTLRLAWWPLLPGNTDLFALYALLALFAAPSFGRTVGLQGNYVCDVELQCQQRLTVWSLHSALCINWTSDRLTSSTITFKRVTLQFIYWLTVFLTITIYLTWISIRLRFYWLIYLTWLHLTP